VTEVDGKRDYWCNHCIEARLLAECAKYDAPQGPSGFALVLEQ
jgi:hypothetical protein